jgi:hypothetical protein
VRIKVKGTMVRGATSPATEPNFYSMPKVKVAYPSPLGSTLPSLCEVNDEQKPCYVKQMNTKGFLYDEGNLCQLSLRNDTYDEVSDCNDEEMCSLIEQLQNPLNLSPVTRDTLNDEWALDDISPENDRSDHLLQHFSRDECSVLCTVLNSIFF